MAFTTQLAWYNLELQRSAGALVHFRWREIPPCLKA